MKLEIEAKIKVKNLATLAKKLPMAGAVRLHTVHEQDLYFDNSEGMLCKTNCGLRLRKRKTQHSTLKTQIYLTYKGPTGKSTFKSRQEIQVQIDDFDGMKNIFLGLDFKNTLAVNKTRQIWRLGKCEICLDKVHRLGNFVEVEGPSEKAITMVLDKLGLDKSKHISIGYAKMLAVKKR
jgi:adenylate cyclase class 2